MSINRKIIRQRKNAIQLEQSRDPHVIKTAIDIMRDGLACHENGDFQSALTKYKEALAHNPRFSEAYNAIGIALRNLNDLENALDAHMMAVTLKPDHVGAHFNCGNLLLSQGQYAEAAKWFQKTVNLDPEHAEAYNNLGQALHKLCLFQAAIRAYEAAIKVDPEYGGVYHNLGLSLIMMGRRHEAVAPLEKAVACMPNATMTLSYMVTNKMYLCDWENIDALSQKIVDAVMEKRGYSDPFIFQSLSTAPGNAEQLACAASSDAISTGIRKQANLGDAQKFTYQHLSGRRIRVGYASMDFRSHPMAYLMTDVLEKHDRDKFEVYAYSYGPHDNSPERKRFMEVVDHFIDIHGMTDDQAAQRINEDGIDILIDRKGHTYGSRLGIFVYRPAPIQVCYLAHAGTIGADYIDYAVVDAFVVPPDQQQFYTEKLVYMPDSYQANSIRPVAKTIPSRAECGLPESGLVFCCFNQSYKYTPKVFDLWMRILKRTPDSVLWLFSTEDETADNLRREAQMRGVDPNRLVFAPKMPQAQHLARHHHADLFLDTLIVNAHTTASDALLMGCPVITCPGETFVARVAGSVLRALEMPELIVSNLQEYEDLAVAIATDPARLRALREKVAQKVKTAPLFNSTRYTRHLDAAYLEMWRLQQAGEKPKPFAIAPIEQN